MTELALIPPTAYINVFASNMSLLLAHRFSDPDYVRFYQNKADLGEFLILDNSAYEEGEAIINMPMLLSMSSLVRCREIVVPDAIMDSTRTWARTMEAVHFMSSDIGRIGWHFAHSPRIMVVPQANHRTQDILDYKNHAGALLEAWLCVPHLQDSITLGVSKNMHKLDGGWPTLFDQAIQPLMMEYPSVEVHCLGAPKDIPMLCVLFKEHTYIRSLDTALPFVCAMYGVELNDNGFKLPNRPQDYEVRYLDDDQLVVAQRNIDFLENVLR